MRFAPSVPASVLPIALAALAALAPAVRAAGADAEITLRKSFRALPPPAAQTGTAGDEAVPLPGAAEAGATALPAREPPPDLGGLAEGLGEGIVERGTLHLPDVDGRVVTIDAGATPLLETASGRRLIVDAAGELAPGLAGAIERRWPSYAVVQPTPGDGARGLLAAVLEKAGYASVTPEAPILFGREARVRIVPDYVVLRRDGDLLAGQTRALSVVDAPAEAIPAELREMAVAHRILVLDLLDGDGRPVPPPPWRDPRAPVTTVGAASPAFVLREVATALGFETAPEAAVAAAAAAPLAVAVGELLAELGVPAIGPAVELSRPVGAERRRRFTITVPGWLAETGGRRLLVTGAELPAPLRLFLVREGIAVFQYRAP